MSTHAYGVVVLISGRGSNLRAILEHRKLEPQVRAVLSDNPDAPGLEIAEDFLKRIYICDEEDVEEGEEWEDLLLQHLREVRPELVVLAGFMRILSARALAAIAEQGGRVVNIHPSLLPKFPGLDTHRRALEAGEAEHGCSVHWVNEQVDGGEVIAQSKLEIKPGERADALAARVLRLEHELYPRVLMELLE